MQMNFKDHDQFLQHSPKIVKFAKRVYLNATLEVKQNPGFY